MSDFVQRVIALIQDGQIQAAMDLIAGASATELDELEGELHSRNWCGRLPQIMDAMSSRRSRHDAPRPRG